MKQLTAEAIKRALCDLTVVEPNSFGFEVAVPQVYSNGETVVVTVQEEGAGFYVHDSGNAGMILESGGVAATPRLQEELRRGVNAYGCSIAQFRVYKQCKADEVAATVAIVGCASRFVADFAHQVEAPAPFDFRRQVLETLNETIGADRIRENDEIRAKSGTQYRVSATVLDERRTKPLAYVEAISNHQAVARKFRALYDIMNTPIVSDTPRIAIFDDVSSNITGADLALLGDVSRPVAFRERNDLPQVLGTVH